MSDTDTDPRQLVVVNARTGTATHLLDRRYAATGQALCGTSVPVGNRPTHDHVSCTTCRSVEKGNPRPSRRPPRPRRKAHPDTCSGVPRVVEQGDLFDSDPLRIETCSTCGWTASGKGA